MSDNTYEFDCIECGRHMIRFGCSEPRGLCGLCIHLPGWFRDPALVKSLDPDYDPSEPISHDPSATGIEPAS